MLPMMFLFLPKRSSSNTVLCPLVLQAFLISDLFHNIRYVFFKRKKNLKIYVEVEKRERNKEPSFH